MEWKVGGAKLEGDLWTILHCLFRVEKGRMLKKQGKGTRYEGGLWGKTQHRSTHKGLTCSSLWGFP